MNSDNEVWWIKPALAGATILVYLVVLGAVMWEGDKDSLKLIVGSTLGFVSGALSFYFGSSSSSARKDQIIASAPPVQSSPVPVVNNGASS